MSLPTPAKTSHIKGELDYNGDFIRDIEVLVTADNLLSERQARAILNSFYPAYNISNVTVEEV